MYLTDQNISLKYERLFYLPMTGRLEDLGELKIVKSVSLHQSIQKWKIRASLVVQWLNSTLPLQEM